MELWDLYDKDRRPLNKLHKRGKPIPHGEYHIAVSILTLNSKGEILLTLRSADKQPYPAMWEITAGSVVAGEESLHAAVRELYEETGIEADESELVYIGENRGTGAIVDMYMVRRDIDLKDLRLQKGETEEAKWVTPAEFEAVAESGSITPPVVRRYYRCKALGVFDS
ncbi:MAG: NUDIX domain-containing protein [Firmicutes bacterium]|nr:NUDIX domain-containing protein [Bacillota bacterium]